MDDSSNSHGCAYAGSINEDVNGCRDRSRPVLLQIVGNEIRFSTPKRGAINLRIYNICGRLENELVSGVMETGEHIVKLPALRNGVYFAKLNYNNSSYTTKFVIIR